MNLYLFIYLSIYTTHCSADSSKPQLILFLYLLSKVELLRLATYQTFGATVQYMIVSSYKQIK